MARVATFKTKKEAEETFLPRGVYGFAQARDAGCWVWIVLHDGKIWEANEDDTMTEITNW